jgi:sugar lactone lactonase YvrE/GNAT superfamily N-acetyltransferase
VSAGSVGRVIIRDARSGEHAVVGELRVAAYRALGLLPEGSRYAETLRGFGFGGDCTVLVAVDTGENNILGTITLQPFDPSSELAQDETEADIRAFAVAPLGQGRGVGRELLLAVIECAQKRGMRRVRLCTQPAMKAARHLYETTGFSRTPDLDFEPAPGLTLQAFELTLADGNGPVPSTFWAGRAVLGECPLWDSRNDTLYWVDFSTGTVFAQAYGGRRTAAIDVATEVSCVGLTDDPQVLIAGLRTGWHLLDMRTGNTTFLADPEADRPTCRFNDGAVDPEGRFWTGSLEEDQNQPVGRLYRLDGDGQYTTADQGFRCSNGIDWSPDGRWMYFVDSHDRVIYRYAFDVGSGAIADRQVFADTSSLPGVPDGLAVDAAGDIWCAFWDGAHLTRFTSGGTVAETVPVPVPRPTSITFGGAGLRTLYITSASIDLTEDQLMEWPLSGSVLSLAASTPGRHAVPFRLRDGRAVTDSGLSTLPPM